MQRWAFLNLTAERAIQSNKTAAFQMALLDLYMAEIGPCPTRGLQASERKLSICTWHKVQHTVNQCIHADYTAAS